MNLRPALLGLLLLTARASSGQTLLTGADVSLLAALEASGAVYRDAGGSARDPLSLLHDRGCRLLRLRLWVNPSGQRDQVCDLPYTIALAQRIKRAGFQLLLDLHYSDTWADPGHQAKPADWRELPFDALVQRVHDYSRDVVQAFAAAGARPEMVQVGNEIAHGFLWPDGKLDGTDEAFMRFARLVRAGCEGVQAGAGGASVQRMIHSDRGGDPAASRWLFRKLVEAEVPFELIGLSYYPYWHGPLDGLRENLRGLATFKKPILVVEAGYPWRGANTDHEGRAMAYPASPAGQRQYLEDVMAAVRAAPDGLGRGVLWWAPEWIPTQALGGGWSPRTLFDDEGRALPALEALRVNPPPL